MPQLVEHLSSTYISQEEEQEVVYINDLHPLIQCYLLLLS